MFPRCIEAVFFAVCGVFRRLRVCRRLRVGSYKKNDSTRRCCVRSFLWQSGPFIEVLYKIQERRFDLPASVEGLDEFWPAAKPIDFETLSNADMASAPSLTAAETALVPEADASWMAEVHSRRGVWRGGGGGGGLFGRWEQQHLGMHSLQRQCSRSATCLAHRALADTSR